jgi:hypothetical protein
VRNPQRRRHGADRGTDAVGPVGDGVSLLDARAEAGALEVGAQQLGERRGAAGLAQGDTRPAAMRQRASPAAKLWPALVVRETSDSLGAVRMT